MVTPAVGIELPCPTQLWKQHAGDCPARESHSLGCPDPASQGQQAVPRPGGIGLGSDPVQNLSLPGKSRSHSRVHPGEVPGVPLATMMVGSIPRSLARLSHQFLELVGMVRFPSGRPPGGRHDGGVDAHLPARRALRTASSTCRRLGVAGAVRHGGPRSRSAISLSAPIVLEDEEGGAAPFGGRRVPRSAKAPAEPRDQIH